MIIFFWGQFMLSFSYCFMFLFWDLLFVHFLFDTSFNFCCFVWYRRCNHVACIYFFLVNAISGKFLWYLHLFFPYPWKNILCCRSDCPWILFSSSPFNGFFWVFSYLVILHLCFWRGFFFLHICWILMFRRLPLLQDESKSIVKTRYSEGEEGTSYLRGKLQCNCSAGNPEVNIVFYHI